MDLDPRALFDRLDPGHGIVAAVSGGSDSLALLLLLHDFVRRRRPPTRLHALTVDHGLRPGSAAEARQVAALCAARGIAHETVSWRGAKPATGLSAAAREARYRLLADAAARLGCGVVLTGHTRDDQAETLAMRAARGGEGAGLAGMAPETLFDGRVWIVRPLLGLRRRALRDWLAARDAAWIDDPSNEDPAFERVRVRRALSDAEVEALARRAGAEGAARRALAGAAAGLADRFAGVPVPGLVRLDHAFFALETERQAALLAFRALLAAAGGTPRLPDAARAGALLSRLAAGERLRATLSRAVVDARRDAVYLLREARGLPVAAIAAGAQLLWDGRWRVAAPAAGGPWSVGPLGGESAANAPAPADVPQSLVRAALAACPAVPPGVEAVPVVAPYARFLPGFDLALAAALGRVFGAAALPAAPWKRPVGAEP